MSEPLSGHLILEGPLLSAQEMLARTEDRFAGAFDPERVVEFVVLHDGRLVFRVLESVHHADGGEREANDDKESKIL